MIRDLFLPSYIKGRYIIPQRIVGIDIGRTYVSASQIYLRDTTITIEKCINEPLEMGNNTNYDERIINALKNLKPQLNHYNVLRTALPSSIAIIKELTLPFIEPEKIKMVLGYEIEPLLPFSLNDAIVDGIITKIMPEEHKSLVLVAAVPKEYIANHLQLLHAADLDPDIISIDFFDLYELYRKMPNYSEAYQAHVLIDIESHTTRIGYIYNGALRIVRTLPKGMVNQVKLISDSLGMQPSAVMEQIIRYGFNHEDRSFTQALREALDTYWQDIAFTLISFTAQSDKKIDKILIVGAGAEIHGFPSFITEKTGTTCEKIDINQITHQKNIITKQNGVIAQNCIMSLATALNSPETSSFNLRQKEFASTKTPLMIKQFIIAGILSCAIVFGLIGYTVYQLSSLHLEISASTEEASRDLMNNFPKIASSEDEEPELDTLITAAEQKVDQLARLMNAFSGGHRASFLQYLFELTNIIHKDELSLTLDRLQIDEKTLILQGEVPTFTEVKALEDDLRKATLFTYNDRIQKEKFIATIQLKNTGGL
jgi:type IV pilus assembly protein PilM